MASHPLFYLDFILLKRLMIFASLFLSASAGASTFDLEQSTMQFNAKVHNLDGSADCLPIHVNQENLVNIFYQYCSTQAYIQDGAPTQVSPAFKVTAALARRYNFWRRIYSVWEKDQHVMHASVYPEVVLEVLDASRIVGVSERERLAYVRPLADRHRRLYRQLLLTMHQQQNRPQSFTPAMQRIAAAMHHITDTGKYLKAAYSLRTQRGQRDYIAEGIARANKYLDPIKEAFAAQGVPGEISRLAFVESSFNLKAESKVGAAGVYQIMPQTGAQYMRVGDDVDERRDPVKAAHAAAKLLKLYYGIIGDWPLAITAYNHGIGSVQRAVREAKSTDLNVIIAKYDHPSFGFASKNFFASFLGMLATVENAAVIFPDIRMGAPFRYFTVRLSEPTAVSKLLKKYGMKRATLATFNPDILRSTLVNDGTLPAGFVVKIPDIAIHGPLSKGAQMRSPALATHNGDDGRGEP